MKRDINVEAKNRFWLVELMVELMAFMHYHIGRVYALP